MKSDIESAFCTDGVELEDKVLGVHRENCLLALVEHSFEVEVLKNRRRSCI